MGFGKFCAIIAQNPPTAEAARGECLLKLCYYITIYKVSFGFSSSNA